MEHVITTYGGGELFKLVFDGIAALFKTDSTGVLTPLIRVGLTIGSFYVIILMLYRDQLIEGVKWFLWVVIATNLLFLPKTTVFIHDPLANTKNKVDNVPWALGAFAGLVSYVGKTVTETFESVFSLPNYLPYHKTGTVFASSLMSQVGKFRIVDPVFKGNMERFVNQCVVYDAMIGHKYTLSHLQNTPDIWELVKSKASPVLGFLYQDESSPGAVVTCKEGAQKLEKLWADELMRATSIYGTRVQDRSMNEMAFYTGVLESARLLSDGKYISDQARTILRQEMMINAIEAGSNNKLSELGVAANYAATKALLQQRSAYAIAGEIAARTLPLFKNVIEALSYALFIFIVVLALLPNGHKVLTTYFGILLWTQLWAPLYAVLNLVMTLYGRKESVAQGLGKGLTLLNSSAIINANMDMTTLAAWLSVSIPFISYGILKQGAGAFVGLAQHLGSAMQAASSGAAAETVSGNISLGNISMGTQAYQNTSAFQHNTSPSHNSSQFTTMGLDGIETATHATGSQTFTDHGVSQGSVQEMATYNESVEMQQRLSHAENFANSKSMAAGKQMESAYQQTANFMNHVGSDVFAGENYNKSLTSSESKALQEHKNLIDDIKSSGHFTEAQAVEAAIYAKGGIEVMGTGAGISGNFSSNAARQKAIETAQSFAKTKGYTESLDKVLSAAKAVSEGQNDTKGTSLAEGAMASFNEARHMREEATLAHSKVDEISNSFSSTQSTGIQEQRNITQEILDYIAEQPAPSSPDGNKGGSIGARGALAIQQQGGEEYQAYKRGFQGANPQYSVAGINVGQEQEKLETQFESTGSSLGRESTIRDHYSHNAGTIHGKGDNASLELEGPSPTANANLSASMEWQNGERLLEGAIEQKNQEGSTSRVTEAEINISEQKALTPLDSHEGLQRKASSSYTSLKEEVEERMTQQNDKFGKGIKTIGDEHERLTMKKASADSKTLLGSSLVGADQSFKRGVGIDEEKIMERLKKNTSSNLVPSEKIKQ
ncbi:MAG: conjugal transfer protein TraG N-terminal domain-containing protein [Proteobacteria bacterium]|nr:conjugal transfer protein TraG N-terminal domain-containing protein [Pseudomonadota bacterium]